MKSNINRPVFLAQRNALLEKAMETLPACLESHPFRKRKSIDAVLYLLEAALEPSQMAFKSTPHEGSEESLVAFVRWVLSYLTCARSIIENESQLKNGHEPLWKFLDQKAWSESAGLNRVGEPLLRDVVRLFQAGHAPFMDHQQKLVDSLNPEERSRYQRAYKDFKAHGTTVGKPPPRTIQARPNFLASS